MTSDEKGILQNAILSIADPVGNWEFGWQKICELAAMDPAQFPAPFRKRDLEQEVFEKLRQGGPKSGSSGSPQGEQKHSASS